jgi:hypothetical protein
LLLRVLQEALFIIFTPSTARLEKMLRWTKYGLLSALLSLILYGCGGGGGGSSSTSTGNPPQGTTASITLSWETPVSQADGKPLADLAGFNIYYGKSSQAYSDILDVGNVRNHTFQNMSPGNYFFAITAYDSAGNETDSSPEVEKSIP